MEDKMRVELFRIGTDEYEPFEGKALAMLKNLIESSESVEMFRDCEGDIQIIGSKFI